MLDKLMLVLQGDLEAQHSLLPSLLHLQHLPPHAPAVLAPMTSILLFVFWSFGCISREGVRMHVAPCRAVLQGSLLGSCHVAS